MGKDSALYQLMGVRMNGIVSGDGEYQAIIRKSDEYSSRLERMGLPVDVRQLIDRYISEQNALDAQAVLEPCRDGPHPGLVIAFIGVGDEVRLGMPLGLCESVAASVPVQTGHSCAISLADGVNRLKKLNKFSSFKGLYYVLLKLLRHFISF